MPDNLSYGIIILAAGNSSRLGQPKQLLIFRGISLLQHVTNEAEKIEDAVVAVVTGAWKEQVENDLAGKEILLIHNADWESGMASSIRAGILELTTKYPELDAIIFTVCDQPFLSDSVFRSLVQEFLLSGKGMIASSYKNTMGTPVLFSRKYFPELLQLEGQEGAKKLIHAHSDDCSAVAFPGGETDIDTMQDYEILFS